MKTFFKYFKPEIFPALLGILFVGAVALIELYQIQLMAQIIDVGIAQSNLDIILSVGFKMVFLALLGVVIAMLGLYFPSQVSNNFALRLREALFKKVQTFSHKTMTSFQTSSLVTRLTNDVNFLQRTIMMSLRLLVRAPIFLVSSVYLTYLTSPQLSVVMLGAVVFLSTVLGIIIVSGFPKFIKLQKMIDNMNRKVQESLMNIRVIKSFVREEFEDTSFDKENSDLYNANVSAMNLMIIMNPALTTAVHVATIFIVWFASFMIVDTQIIQVGDLLVFINYLRFIMFSMFMITNVLVMISRSKASVLRMKEILDTKTDILPGVVKMSDSTLKGVIKFKDVSFRFYQDSQNVLENVSFEIQPGERIGIIGSTGSGKSTLVNLMVRLIDSTKGKILIDNTDIKDLDLKYLRSMFGFVPQKNVLFSGTIKSNLSLGVKDPTEEDIIKATKTADIYNFIDGLDKRFESEVLQGGVNFSGGQKQRLCIARALILNPRFLVLDDSTSALDAKTEKNVKDAIMDNYKDCSIINIAQKISSVSDSDKIIVIDEGKIVGIGKHDDLLATCDIYQEIYQSQIKKGDLE